MQKNERTHVLSERIKQLGEKSTQLLIFLSFAMVSVATLKGIKDTPALNEALLWWKVALFPILLSVLPLKEIRWEQACWYECIRWTRVGLHWLAIAFIARGLWSFLSG